MTSEEFVKAFYDERISMLKQYCDNTTGTAVAVKIGELKLDQESKLKLRGIIGQVLTDVFYSVLLALDGEASLGGKQVAYQLLDEDGNELTGGEIEAFAYEYFQQSDPDI